MRFFVPDYAAVGRNAYFAVGECIKRIDSFVGRCARDEVDDDFGRSSSVVVDLAYLNLALLLGADDRSDQCRCRFAKWQLSDGKCLIVNLFDFGSDFYSTATLTVVVACDIDETTCLEVGIQLEWLIVQICYRCVEELVEVVRQNFGRQTDGDTFDTLCQKQREFHRQSDRLFLAAVVGWCPFRNLRTEHCLKSKL